MAIIRVLTQKIVPGEYDAGLANSIHFETDINGKPVDLNRGYGILFPKAEIRSNNTIDPRGIINPGIVKKDSIYVIFGDCVNEQCKNMAPGKVYSWETEDFVEFTDKGLVDFSGERSCEIEIDDCLLDGILKRWVPPFGMNISSQRKFEYPLIKGFADPVVFNRMGKWYFLATNDLNGNIGLFMRESESVDGLFSDGCRVSVILDYNEENEFIQTFWAPEWHIIGGVPYILFAVGGHKWAPQSHMMKYKGEGDIMEPSSWEKPVRVKKKDGSFLSEDGITLDMTYVKNTRGSYVIWSERYNIGTPLDSGSMIYIASVDEKNPAVLTSDKVLLTRPVYGWENVAGTINNEGPYCIDRNGHIVISYSGGDACGHYYAVGALIASNDADLLDISNWEKLITPFFNAYTLKEIDGPGHSSFFVDESGNDMVAFHGQDHGRQSGIHPVHFNEKGIPVLLDM